jgi:hypothetical protein
MSKIVVTHNFQRLSAMLTGLGDKKAVQKAVSRSIKRTLITVRKVGSQEIRAKKLLKLSAKEAKQKVHAYDEAIASKPVAEQYGKIWFGGKGESLGRFYARRVVAGRSKSLMKQDKYGGWQGVRLFNVKLNTWGAPYLKTPERSFLSVKKGGPVVFTRMAGAKRLPIEKQKGPGMSDLVEQSGIIRTLAATASRRYQAEFAVNVKFYAEQAIARGKSRK